MSEAQKGAVPMRPRPLPDEASEGYWQAANEGCLAIQRCQDCRRWNHAPSLNCPACGSGDLDFEKVSGEATLFSWTVVHHSPGPGFAGKLPLARHRMVYATLGDRMGGEIHALSLKTLTPDEAAG